MGSMQLFPFFLPFSWKTTCKSHACMGWLGHDCLDICFHHHRGSRWWLCYLPYCPAPLRSAGVWSGASSRLIPPLSDMGKEGLLPLALPGADVHPNTWCRDVLLTMQPHCVQILLSHMWCILVQRLRWEPSLPSNGSSCTAWRPSHRFWSTPHSTIMGGILVCLIGCARGLSAALQAAFQQISQTVK